MDQQDVVGRRRSAAVRSPNQMPKHGLSTIQPQAVDVQRLQWLFREGFPSTSAVKFCHLNTIMPWARTQSRISFTPACVQVR